jgi:Na+-driven multidrug efflux pump
MIKRMLTRIMHRLQLRESWIIFFILGIIMMTFPFMHIFNKPTTLFGIPLMMLYLTIGWAISILVIYLFMRSFLSHNQNPDEKKDE